MHIALHTVLFLAAWPFATAAISKRDPTCPAGSGELVCCVTPLSKVTAGTGTCYLGKVFSTEAGLDVCI